MEEVERGRQLTRHSGAEVEREDGEARHGVRHERPEAVLGQLGAPVQVELDQGLAGAARGQVLQACVIHLKRTNKWS